MVGDSGTVIAVDLQSDILEQVRRRVEELELTHQLQFHLCDVGRIGVNEQVDSALA